MTSGVPRTMMKTDIYVLFEYNSWDSNPYHFIGAFSSLEGAMSWIPGIHWSVSIEPSEYNKGVWAGSNGKTYKNRTLAIDCRTLNP